MKTNCKICYKQFEKINNSQIYCSVECKRIAKKRNFQKWYYNNKDVGEKQNKYKGRYSGKEYENPPEKLNAIREKYKNGVTREHIEIMFEVEK